MDIKIKLFSSTNLPEIIIRRFKIDIESFTFYQFLCHIKTLFNLNESEPIFIKWQTNNQWLTESEFNKFKDELSKSKDLVTKLDVFCGNVHFNIECDICGNIIIGDRHKCLQCDDFDICGSCFHCDPNIHKEHCLLLLRSPEDTNKFIKTFKGISMDTHADFRVIDIDIDNLIAVETSTSSTQTEVPSKSDEEIDDKSSDNAPQSQVENIFDSSVSEEYINSLPQSIIDSLKLLRSMGFKNLTSPLVALLVANNGNIYQVLDEIEFTQKRLT